MDERQSVNAGKAALITLALISFGAIGVLVFDYVQNKEVTNGAAVITLLGAGGLFWIIDRMFGAEAPRSLLGAELPTGPSAGERGRRRNSYALHAGLFAIALTVLSVGGLAIGDPDAFGTLPLPGGIVTSAVLGLTVMFGLAFGLNWVLGESQSKSVEKRLAALEA